MRYLGKVLTIPLIGVFLIGCANHEVQNEIESLTQKVSELESEIERIKSLRERESLFENMDKIAYLTPGTEGYSTINTDLGKLTVNLKDISPYANGSRVVLTWGNIHSSRINGLSMTLEWGRVDSVGNAINEPSFSKEHKMVESLIGGSWRDMRVTLGNVPPSELGFVRVRDVTHSGISLNN